MATQYPLLSYKAVNILLLSVMQGINNSDNLSKPVFVHILSNWLWRTSLVPAQHEICQARHEQVVISRNEFNAADMITMRKCTQLAACHTTVISQTDVDTNASTYAYNVHRQNLY